MNAFARCLLLAAAAEAQLVLPILERPYLRQAPLEAKAFRIDSLRWVVVGRVEMAYWLDYAFDSLIQVRFRLYGEDNQLLAETLLALSSQPTWQGHFHWSLSPTLSDKWVYLEVFPEAFPEGACYTRLYLPGGIVQGYLLVTGAWLSPPITFFTLGGGAYQVMPGDSLWGVFFEPARVDTSWPPLPYVLSKSTRRRVYTPCAWHLKGDTTQVFWTCTLPGNPPKKLSLNPTWRQEARQRFSALKPGDRTDFGLIYASLGPPDLRIYTTTLETWVYVRQKLSFVFDRQGQDWVLQRRIEYQAVWK